MKSAWLFAISELLLVMTAVCFFINVQGSVNAQFGSALSAWEFSIQGTSKGGWIVVGWLCLLAAVVTFVAGLVRVIREPAVRT